MPLTGTLELSKLIRSMSPSLDAETYVFAHIPTNHEEPDATGKAAEWLAEAAVTQAQMLFREREACTVIISQTLADGLGLDFTFPCKKVTLDVHSSLDAVGFLAAVTTRLAERLRVGVNPVSGYFHDHLFVPLGKEELVMEELKAMAAEQASAS